MMGKDARLTLLVGGAPLRIVPVRDLVFRPWPIDEPLVERVYGNGYAVAVECVAANDFDALWYDVVHHQTALDRWADDGGAVT